jgi:GAF domain-containing protein
MQRDSRPGSQLVSALSGPLDDGVWSRSEIDALLRVSAAVSVNASLSAVLQVIPTEACRVTSVDAADVVLAPPGAPLRVMATWGHSARYVKFLESMTSDSGWMARLAVQERAPVAIDDLFHAPQLKDAPARARQRMAAREGYTAFLSVPLTSGGRTLGALDVWRRRSGPWRAAEVELMVLFAQHAASAIDGTRLIDFQRGQVDALERLVGILRDQTHEHANRLHAVSGLLALGELGEAQAFLAELIALHHANYASIIDRVQHPVLAALLVAQMSIARQRGVEVKLSQRTHVEENSRAMRNADAVGIVTSLLENAVEAASMMQRPRRRVSLTLNETAAHIGIIVRDWSQSDTPVADLDKAVSSARGKVEIQRLANGTRVRVRLPLD